MMLPCLHITPRRSAVGQGILVKGLVPFICLALCVLGSVMTHAQSFKSGTADELEASGDSLALREEFWVGVNLSSFYQQNFGSLTVQYVGSEAPGASKLYANTQGGSGYGLGGGPMIEFRPIRSPLAFGLTLMGEWRTFRSESSTPISNDIYAFNAIFETHATAWYATVAPYMRYQLTASGAYVLGGLTVEVPMKVTDAHVWQHELPIEGQAPGVNPGSATTSIRFKTDVDMGIRFGMQFGFGHDFMVGLFGYKNQLISPYFVLQGGTPIVSSPSALNGLTARMGVLWKYGF